MNPVGCGLPFCGASAPVSCLIRIARRFSCLTRAEHFQKTDAFSSKTRISPVGHLMNGQRFSAAQHAALCLDIYLRISLYFRVVQRIRGYSTAAQTVSVLHSCAAMRTAKLEAKFT